MTSISSGGFRLLGIMAGLALLATVGTGCGPQGGGGQDGGGEASEGSTAHPAPTQDTSGAPVIDEEPRTDLTNQQVVEWTDYEAVSDQQLRFSFPTGTPDCYGARYAVEEDASTVWVATIVGVLPDAPEDCTLVGRTATILVPIESPVGDRTVEHLEVAEELP